MPNIVSGKTDAACIMIGENVAELVAADHQIDLDSPVNLDRSNAGTAT